MDPLIITIQEAVAEKKATNPVVLDLTNISSITDCFIICSAQTAVQVRAIADNIIDKTRETGNALPQVEGYQEGRWVLLDFGNLVAHILMQQEREFYTLENLWHDARVVAE